MKRRQFIKLSSGLGIAPLINHNLFSREAIVNGGKSQHFQDVDVEEASVLGLQNAMKSGKLSSSQLTQKYLDRIRDVDKKLNSVIEINPDALKIAEEMDSERKNGRVRGALHGIPVLIKDNIDTGDRMVTTAGSLA